MSQKTIEIKEIVFKYEEGKPVFGIHESTGAIRPINSEGRKLVFIHPEHLYRYTDGKTYRCLGKVTDRPDKKAEFFIPGSKPIIDSEIEVLPSPVEKIESMEQPGYKKPKEKTAGKGYFENFGISFQSTKNIKKVLLWAKEHENVRLEKSMNILLTSSPVQ